MCGQEPAAGVGTHVGVAEGPGATVASATASRTADCGCTAGAAHCTPHLYDSAAREAFSEMAGVGCGAVGKQKGTCPCADKSVW